MFVPNHIHFIAKGHVEYPPMSERACNDWLRRLVQLVKMRVVAGPTSTYVREIGNEGVTGTITLATSHASIHVWDSSKPSLIQFDLYSCQEYSVESVISHLDEFGLVDLEWIVLDRNFGIDLVKSGKFPDK